MAKIKSPRWTWFFYWLILGAFYLPLLGLFVGAFLRTENGATEWSWYWFGEVFKDSNLVEALENSVLVGVSAATLATILGTAAALGLRRSHGWDSKLLENFSLLSLFLPEIVVALSLLSWFFYSAI